MIQYANDTRLDSITMTNPVAVQETKRSFDRCAREVESMSRSLK